MPLSLGQEPPAYGGNSLWSRNPRPEIPGDPLADEVLEVPIELFSDLQMLVLRYGYLALFVLLMLEEAGIPLPVPGDLLIAYAGFLAAQGHMELDRRFRRVPGSRGAGRLHPLFAQLRWGRPAINRYGRILRLTPEKIQRAESFFWRRGRLAVIVGQLTPGLRTVTSIVSGLFAAPAQIFVPSTLVASAFWVAVFLLLGSLGEAVYDEARGFIQPRWPVFLATVLVAVVGVLLWKLGVASLFGSKKNTCRTARAERWAEDTRGPCRRSPLPAH